MKNSTKLIVRDLAKTSIPSISSQILRVFARQAMMYTIAGAAVVLTGRVIDKVINKDL